MKYLAALLLLLVLAGTLYAVWQPTEDTPVVAQSPQHTELASRASAHIQQRQYPEALAEIDAALAQVPDHAQYRFLQCLLGERLGQDEAIARDCYARVVAQLARTEAQCEADLNCVVADLMAQGPNAEARRQRLLALPTPTAELEARHFLLEGFSREGYLRTILP